MRPEDYQGWIPSAYQAITINRMVRTKLERTSLSALLRLFTKFGLRLRLALIKCPCMVRTKLEKTSLSALLKYETGRLSGMDSVLEST